MPILPAYDVLNVGFAAMPEPDILIDETGYQLHSGSVLGQGYTLLTGAENIAQYNADYPGLNLVESYDYFLYTGTITPGTTMSLSAITGLFWDKAHDDAKDYDVTVQFTNISVAVPSDYTLPFIIMLRTTANGQFEIYGGRHYTTATGVLTVGKSMDIEVRIYDTSSQVTDKTATMSFSDLDTGDMYAAHEGETDTYGNNYHGHGGYIWPYQEAWAVEFYGGEKFYVTPDTWLTYHVENVDGHGLIRFGNTVDEDCLNNDCTMAYNTTFPMDANFTTAYGSLRLFAPLKCYVVATAGTGGSITHPGSTAYDFGDDATYTITVDEGYAITDVTVDGVSVGVRTSYTFSDLQEDHSITVTFVPLSDSYVITAAAYGEGEITDEGDTHVATGADKTYTMTAYVGYAICKVVVDGEVVDNSSTYTFENVTADHTIEVTFARDMSPMVCCGDFVSLPAPTVCPTPCPPTPGECPEEDLEDRVEALEGEYLSLQTQVDNLRTRTNTAYNNAATALNTANSAASDAQTALTTANGIASTANQALTKAQTALDTVNGLVIGGTQLLRNTYDMVATSPQSADGALQTSNVTTGGETYLHRPVGYYNNTGSSYTNILSWRYIYCELGQTYTLSFYIKSTAAQTEQVGVYFAGSTGYTQVDSGVTSQGKTTTANNGLVYIDTTADWQRVWVKWTLKDTGNTETYKQAVIRVLAGADAYISGVKLEKGNVPTDWSYNHLD